MKFAKYTYLIAGIYGIVVLLPMYFLKDYVGQENPPPLTHPEFFYGFVGVALAWQFVFLIISREPLKYRPLMLISILEKAAWGVPVLILYLQKEVSASMLAAGISDLIWGALFVVSYLKTAR
jgi:O-antigen/teichoic acid export membrane protein